MPIGRSDASACTFAGYVSPHSLQAAIHFASGSVFVILIHSFMPEVPLSDSVVVLCYLATVPCQVNRSNDQIRHTR
jgi:hypothetical protein